MLLSLVAGEAADRRDRRLILVFCYLGQLVASVGLHLPSARRVREVCWPSKREHQIGCPVEWCLPFTRVVDRLHGARVGDGPGGLRGSPVRTALACRDRQSCSGVR